MKQTVYETLSALMDDEADELELRRLLKTLPEDSSLKDSWRRWHLIRAGLHQEAYSHLDIDISARVSEALEQEAPPVPVAFSGVDTSGAVRKVFRYLGQSAIAASVALVVLYAAQNVTGPVAPLDTEVAGASTGSLPVFSGNFEPGEFTRMARFSGNETVTGNGIDEERAALDRISRAVYQELDQTRSLQRPVYYVQPSN